MTRALRIALVSAALVAQAALAAAQTIQITPLARDGRVHVSFRLTDFDRLKLFAAGSLQPNGEYAIDIRARISPRRAWMLWPFGRHDATGRAPFTYIR